ncbi:hypothetical protein ZWY2020_023752 [Hordeum vulgare]|nr:hypothetical protein ZWY2020_023752 [Hordeum vulgare]
MDNIFLLVPVPSHEACAAAAAAAWWLQHGHGASKKRWLHLAGLFFVPSGGDTKGSRNSGYALSSTVMVHTAPPPPASGFHTVGGNQAPTRPWMAMNAVDGPVRPEHLRAAGTEAGVRCGCHFSWRISK